MTDGVFDTGFNGGIDAFVLKFRLKDLVTPVVTVNPESELPQTYVLHQNYPNPFNTSTVIRYQVSADVHVTLKVFNTLGQGVRTLVDGHKMTGVYAVTWDGRNDRGREVVSGVYFCRLQTGDFCETVKMVHLK